MVLLGACADNAMLANLGSSGRSVRQSVPAGALDTLRLSDSIAVEVNNIAGTIPADIEVQTAPDTGALTGSVVLSGELVRVHSVGGLTSGASLRSTTPATVLTVILTTARQVAGSIRSFFIQNAGGSTETPLWTTANGTDYVDPHDGSLRTVETLALAPTGGGSTDYLVKLADLSQPCDLPPRLIDLAPGTSGDGRIPLVMIHGWQPSMIGCQGTDITLPGIGTVTSYYQNWDTDGNHAPFDALIATLGTGPTPTLQQQYHPYVFHYPTYQSVIAASEALRNDVAALPGGPAVIVAHSMGGLVARGMLGLTGAPPIRGLITIGTPHAGSLIASVMTGTTTYGNDQIALADFACGGSGLIDAAILGVSAWAVAPTAGLRDLAVESPLIQGLIAEHPQGDRLFTIGGSIGGDPNPEFPYTQFDCLTSTLSGAMSDGVVTTASALPAWTAGQRLFPGMNHSQLLSADPATNPVLPAIRDALTRFASCQNGTPPVTPLNAFPLSGSIARESNSMVDVTLNGIVINGVVQTDLPPSDFTIVENGCAIPSNAFTVSTGEGHVGVDLVFIQDLSGSMDSVIAGVRNTVIGFAGSLAAQGLDVQFGSVGYSGYVSQIPSTPAGSTYEFLGPVQDLTSAAAFQSFVATQWASGGGGDLPENGLEAIEYAMNHLSWRPGAVRVLVDITNSGHHVAGDSCDNDGPCTDENLATITALLAGRAVLHAVAPADAASRTSDGALDPWLIATATGGQDLVLGTGVFDLNAIGLGEAIAATTRLTFRSASSVTAPENLRVLVTINGQTSELSPGLLSYRTIPSELRHARPRLAIQ